MKLKMDKIDGHLRTMLRKVIWKPWKTPQKRAWGLRKLGVDSELARRTSIVATAMNGLPDVLVLLVPYPKPCLHVEDWLAAWITI